jgi:hypothetical protein
VPKKPNTLLHYLKGALAPFCLGSKGIKVLIAACKMELPHAKSKNSQK